VSLGKTCGDSSLLIELFRETFSSVLLPTLEFITADFSAVDDSLLQQSAFEITRVETLLTTSALQLCVDVVPEKFLDGSLMQLYAAPEVSLPVPETFPKYSTLLQLRVLLGTASVWFEVELVLLSVNPLYDGF